MTQTETLSSEHRQVKAKQRVFTSENVARLGWVMVTLPIITDAFVDWGQYQIHVIEVSERMITAGLSIIGAAICPYRKAYSKIGLFVCAGIFMVATTNYLASLAFGVSFYRPLITAIHIAVIAYFLRTSIMSEAQGVEFNPDANTDWYGLLPIHSFKGLAQALFLPWHMTLYESRIVRSGNAIYLVHKGVFRKIESRAADRTLDDVVWVPLGRRLDIDERCKLEWLVGSRAIFGFRDCRRLFVAGSVRKFLT